MSRVLRVWVSKVRMPRSQRMTCGVAPLHDVLRGEEQLLDGAHHAPLQQDGPPRLPDGLQEGEVLHVARADLEDARVAAHQVHVVLRHDLRDHGEAVALGRGGEDLQALLSQALERVRRRARLEGAAAEELQPEARDQRGAGLHLLLGLHGAGSGDHGERTGADRDAAYLDARGIGMKLAGGQLVRLQHAEDALDSGQLVELRFADGPVVAGYAADRLHGSAAQVRVYSRVTRSCGSCSGSALRLRPVER